MRREDALDADAVGILRTVTVERLPARWMRITTPAKTCTRSLSPSMIL